MTRQFTMTGILIGALAFSLAPTEVSAAAAYDLWWNTVDGGGAMKSVSGAFELSGTFGQPDASGALSGTQYSLTGGFWNTDAGAVGGDGCGDSDGDGVSECADVCPGTPVGAAVGANGCAVGSPQEQAVDDFTTDFKTHYADKGAPCGGCGGLDAAFFGAGLAGYALFVTSRRRRR